VFHLDVVGGSPAEGSVGTFAVQLDDALKGLDCKFTAGYLDDITLGDTVDTLGVVVKHFQSEVAKLGLTLNESKCEIICLAEEL